MMRNKTQKKMQSQVNKAVRALNQNIEDDELWQGRFYMHQKDAKYYPEDEVLLLLLEMTDKKTGRTKEEYTWYVKNAMFFANNLFLKMNNFIVDNCEGEVLNDHRTSCNTIDYRMEARK